jgi:drug/metabolite transporter (DMT)-like permease
VEQTQEINRPAQGGSGPTHSPLLAIGVLVLCCVCWGYSFPVMQLGTRGFDRHVLPSGAGADDLQKFASRALYNGVRFGLAAVLYGLLTWRRQREFSRHEVIGGILVGTFFAGGMLLQVTGLRWILPSVSSFFTALPVVFAPLAQAIIFKKPVGRATWGAVALAVIGIVLLSWPKPEAVAANSQVVMPPFPYLGELLTIAGALVFTAEILCVHHFGQRASAVRLTLVMLATTGLLSFIAAMALGGGTMLSTTAARGLLHDREVGWTMITLIVFSSVLALYLMNLYQPRVSPAIASVVYCTEPLFGTLFSLLFATEQLTRLTIAGGLVVIVSVLVVATSGRDPQLAAEGHLGQ